MAAERATVARVAISSPLPQLDRIFEYTIPSELDDTITAGVRVAVPFGTRKRPLDGYVLNTSTAASYPGTLQPITRAYGEVPVLTPTTWNLARAVADRQAGVASDVLRLAIPPRHVRAERQFEGRWTRVELNDVDTELEQTARTRFIRPKIGGSQTTNGWLPNWALELARLAASELALGRGSILAVPDYRDIELVLDALTSTGTIAEDAVARFDAAQSAEARYKSFLRVLVGDARVVVGNRSAVYAPVSDLGLIAIWDDGDDLYDEPLAPYAHTRDVALVRQSLESCKLVFVSNSESVALERLRTMGFLATEPDPHGPTFVATDELAQQEPTANRRIPELAWRRAVEGLERGPVLIQVARAGYSGVVVCQECGTPSQCTVCHGPLQLTGPHAAPSCRWCGRPATAIVCRVCAGDRVRFAAPGALRTAEDFGKAFPSTPIVLSGGSQVKRTVSDRPAIVVSTPGAEPVAAGGYAAVILLDCASMLLREALTATEDALRRWFNAAALVEPEHGIVVACGISGRLARALASWNPRLFTKQELHDRLELRFPPAVRSCEISGPIGRTRAWFDRSIALASADPAAPAARQPEVLGPVPDGAGGERLLLRSSFADSHALARQLKALIVKTAAASSRASSPDASIRVRFDQMDTLNA